MNRSFKRLLRRFGKLLTTKDIFFDASAVTFNLFLCIIPFTLLLISFIGYVLSYDAAFQEIMRYGREFFPHFSYQTESGDVFQGAITLEMLLDPLIQQRRFIGLVGFGILIFFSQGLFNTIKHVIFDIFDITDRHHPILELIYSFFAFGLVGGVFLFFSAVISLLSLISLDEISLPLTNLVIKLGWLYNLINLVLPTLFTFLLAYTIFRYLSEKRMPPKVSLVGSIVYTVLFEAAKFGVGIYLDFAFRAYKYFYQGYAILVVISVWVFYSALLFVISTIVARSYYDVFYRKQHPVNISYNPYDDIS